MGERSPLHLYRVKAMKVTSPDEVLENALAHGNVIALDFETRGPKAADGLHPKTTPTLFSIASGRGSSYQCCAVRPTPVALAWLRDRVLANPGLKVVMHNCSFDLKICHRFIIPIREIKAQIVDTIVLAWINDNRGARNTTKPFNLKSLADQYLGMKMDNLKNIFKDGPDALARKDLEKRAAKLNKDWPKIAKRHERRKKAYYRRLRDIALEHTKLDETLDKKEKTAANKKIKAAYNRIEYDFERARAATKRLLEMYRKKHAAITEKLKKKFIAYAIDDAYGTLRLYWKLRKSINKKKLASWAKKELLVRVAATDMEIAGIEVNRGTVKELDEIFDEAVAEAKAECHKLAGEGFGQEKLEFNIDSAREVSLVLHAGLKLLPDPKKVQLKEAQDSVKNREKWAEACKKNPELKKQRPTPFYNTPKLVLEYTEHPLAQAVLDYRRLVKLRGTYTKKLSEVKGRLHAYFRSSGTDTGRFACVAAWTPVLTQDGHKRIDQVQVGDMVWTHKQRWMPVTRTIIKGVDHMYDLRLSNGDVLTCTTDHKVLLSDGVTWKAAGELIHERKQAVGREPTQRGPSSATVPVRQTTNAGGSSRTSRHNTPQRRLGTEAPLGPRNISSAQGRTILAVKDGRQEPDDGENWDGSSQLEGGMCRRVRVPHDAGEREEDIRTPACDGTSLGTVDVARDFYRAPHRWESVEQRFGQSGSLHGTRSSGYSQLAGRDGHATIEEINYRDRLEVYDLTVAEDHSYLACGVFNHNSSGPNLQNIPSRDKVGRRIREAFIARPGWKLIVADLSQIELRIAAILCEEPALLKVYSQYKTADDGGRDYSVGDVHEATRQGLDALCPFDVNRFLAKIANFALLYGMSAKTFAIAYKLAYDIAEEVRNAFFQTYRFIEYKTEDLGELWKAGCRSYRIPFSGRQRHWDLFKKYKNKDGKYVRETVYVQPGNLLNTIVQGSAADVLKMVIDAFHRSIVLGEATDRYRDKVNFLLQVHDELVYEVEESVAEEVAHLLKYAMEYAYWVSPIPFLADTYVVDNWGQGKDGYGTVLGPDGKPMRDEEGNIKTQLLYPEINESLHYQSIAKKEWASQFFENPRPRPIRRKIPIWPSEKVA